ncbi:signal peptidase I [Pseudoalteromonas ulvae UL12]|uniref:signal peptidase I n=1 Tax=Pseudoalteromonas ulvae TaxID=107327 RepID=UPI00186B7141|nr:signal peptidase I [Pseudoalteromonas ulvae]MBE0365731.1 signal peptidase I [Pseudoalteromonas ulvae UL12]
MKINRIKAVKLMKEHAGFMFFVIALFASRSSVADWYTVPTGSMQPTIVEGDRIFVNKMAYRLEWPFTDIPVMDIAEPKRGDIVIINSKAADLRLVKRVVGVPGDQVSMVNNRLVVNAEILSYQAIKGTEKMIEGLPLQPHAVQFKPSDQRMANFSNVEVPAGFYLVLGDNRNHSADSRVYGLVPASEIQGQAVRVITSLDPDNFYLPRQERFLSTLI